MRAVGLDGGDGCVFLTDQRVQRLAQAEQVPVRHLRLLAEGVAALGVAVVADVVGIEPVQKLERAVVDGQAQDGHVVGVHHAVAKAHGLPVGQQLGRAFGHGAQQGSVGVAGRGAAGGVVAVDHVIGQLAQLGFLAACGKVFEVAEADEAGRDAADHGGGFHLFAVDGGRAAGQAERARGGNAQGVHGFAAQKLADGRTQHGPPVAPARIWRAARALELQLPAGGGGSGSVSVSGVGGCDGFFLRLAQHLTQYDGTAVAQLPGPHAELVAAVDGGIGLAAGQQAVAGQHLGGLLGLPPAGRYAQLGGQVAAVGQQLGRGQGRGLQPGQKSGAQVGKAVGVPGGLPGRGCGGCSGGGGCAGRGGSWCMHAAYCWPRRLPLQPAGQAARALVHSRAAPCVTQVSGWHAGKHGKSPKRPWATMCSEPRTKPPAPTGSKE